jgi:branched-chain amino acid transport system substrate-binding protein
MGIMAGKFYRKGGAFMNKRFAHGIWAIAVLALAAAVTMVGCQQQDDGAIKLGVSGAHTGDLASYGIPSLRAAELVVAQVNEDGGIDGRQIELVVEDDACKEDQAANAATKLAGEGVVAVMGHICSGATEAALPIYLDSEIVVMSPSATNPPLTKSGNYPNFYRTIAPDDAQARLQVDFAITELDLSTFAVIHDKGTYGQGLAQFARQFLEGESGAEVVLFEGITAGAVDYSAIVNKIAASGAEAVIYGGYHPEASKLVTQIRNAGMEDLVFISDDGVKDDTFIQVAKEYAEDVYATGPIDTSDSELAQKAIEAHREEYGEDPGPFFLNAYAAMAALINAIDSADSTEYEAIRTALQEEFVETTLGNISFDEKGDAIGVGFSMFQVQNGSYVDVAN